MQDSNSWRERFDKFCEDNDGALLWTKTSSLKGALKAFITAELLRERETAVNEWIEKHGPIISGFKCDKHPDPILTCLQCSQADAEATEERVRGDTIEELNDWLWENGITHKKSAQALQEKLRSMLSRLQGDGTKH